MGKSIKKNYLYNTLCQLMVLIIPIITTPYISRVLQAESVGKYSVANAMCTYFVIIAHFGSYAYGQRSTAFYRENVDRLSQSFWDIFSFRVITSTFSFALYWLYLFLGNECSILTGILSLNILCVISDVTWFCQGLEEFKSVAIRNFFVKLLCTIAIFVFVKSQEDLWVYALIISCSAILGNLPMWIVVIKNVHAVNEIHPFNGIKDMAVIFLPTIAIQIYSILDKSMINWITKSDYYNGCYEMSERIVRVALTVVTSIGTVVLPRVANLYHKDDMSEAKEYVYKSFRFTWMLSLPIMCGISAVATIFVPLFLGKGYDDSILLLIIFSWLVIFVSLSNTIGVSYLLPTEQQNVYTISVFIAALANFLLNLVLIPKFNAYGAAVSSVFAEAIGCILQIAYCCKTKQLLVSRIIKYFWKYALASVVMLCCVFLIVFIGSSSWIVLILSVFTGVLIYFGLLLLMKDSFLVGCYQKLLTIVKRNK